MSLLTRKRVLAAKPETTIGAEISLAAADAAMNIYEPLIQSTIEMNQRSAQGSFGNLVSIAGKHAGVATFKSEVYGDGSGGVPFWAEVLLPACGWVDNGSGVFSPTTEAPGTNVKTLTMATYQAGRKKLLTGAMGTFKLVFSSGDPIMIEWNFIGKFGGVTDEAILDPTYPTNKPPRFASSTFTIGGAAAGCIESLEIDAGNNVILRPCPTDSTGIKSALITDRTVNGSMDPESRLVATENVFNKWLTGTEEALVLSMDDGSDVISFNAPKLQRQNVQEGSREDTEIDDIAFNCNTNSGDDEFTITFAASV